MKILIYVGSTRRRTSGKDIGRNGLGGLGWRDARLTCPQVEGETGFHEIWGVALGAVPPYGSTVCAAVRGGRHQTEPVSGGWALTDHSHTVR